MRSGRTLALLLPCLMMLACPPARAQTVWRMTTEYPASAIPGEGVADFAGRIAGSTGGRLTVEPSYDAALGVKSAGMPEAVRNGGLEAGDAFGGAMSATDPIFALSSLPFVANSVAEAKRLATLARADYERALAGHGLRLLYLTPWPPSGIWSKTALASPGDLRALSIRTYDSTSSDVMKKAGAQAFNISFADAQARVRDGQVNAVLSSGDGGAGRKLWEQLPYFAEINYAVPLSMAFVSAEAYEALPPDLRQAVDAAAAATEARQWAAVETRLGENYARMRQNGVAILAPVDPAILAGLKAASTDAVRGWAASAGPRAAALLEAFERR